MRLWSLHPKYLDSKGLVACWRESLLAYAVLTGKTKGYKNHPQLIRFKETKDPPQAVLHYLHGLRTEAQTRGYTFKALPQEPAALLLYPKIKVTTGQIAYEIRFLQSKLWLRDERQATLNENSGIRFLTKLHPIFHMVTGAIEPWEKVKDIKHKETI